MSIRLACCAAAVTAIAAFAPSVASADPTDGPGAVISTAQEDLAQKQATVADLSSNLIKTFDGGNGANVSCEANSAGGALTPETNFVVGKVFAEDFGVGLGKCLSFTDKSYTIWTTVQIQTYNSSTGWTDVPGCSSTGSGRATDGVAAAPATAVCNYGAISPYLEAYHRAKVTVTTSLGNDPRYDASAPWYMKHG